MKRLKSWGVLVWDTALSAVGIAIISMIIVFVAEIIYNWNKVVFGIALALLSIPTLHMILEKAAASIINSLNRSDAVCLSENLTRYNVCGTVVLLIGAALCILGFSQFVSGNRWYIVLPSALLAVYGVFMIYRSSVIKRAAQ